MNIFVIKLIKIKIPDFEKYKKKSTFGRLKNIILTILLHVFIRF